MAWDWTKSGRVDSFEFEKVSCKDVNTTLGSLECSVTGGTLNFSYNSDLKVSGQLNVTNAPSNMQEQEYLIRIWYCPTLDGESKRIEIGTFYFTADLHYENGTYKGTVSLRSTLARHIDDVTKVRWTLGKNGYTATYWRDVFRSLGGSYSINGVSNVKLNKTQVFDVGTMPMAILQFIADTCGGEVAVDGHGRTILQPYQTPATKKKNATKEIVANKDSVILPGLDITSSIKEIPNRVVCVFKEATRNSTKTHKGIAALAATEPRSYQNIGRWITSFYEVNSCSKPYEKNLEKKAKTYLSNANNKITYYEFDTFYQPISIGEVIKLTYDNITVYGLVSNIDLSLSVGAKMHVKIRKV